MISSNVASLILSGIGALAGIVGGYLGYRGYRKSAEMKLRDLRLDLRKNLEDSWRLAENLPNQINHAIVSRRNDMAARGLSVSGQLNAFEDQVKRNRILVSELTTALPERGSNFLLFPESKIEELIVVVHAKYVALKEIETIYNKSAEQDAESVRFRMASRQQLRSPSGG